MMIERNRARCRLCNDIIESLHTHDLKTCSCGAISVDGGIQYIRRLYKQKEDIEELSVWNDKEYPYE